MSSTTHITGIIARYRDFLPAFPEEMVVTLGEGNTPLLPLLYLPKKFGFAFDWFVKVEGLNPTGSFKDRGMTVAISQAVKDGAKTVICASTGNTSASAASYAKRANLNAVVLLPKGNVAKGKLLQVLMHKATVIQVDGNFDDCLQLVRKISEREPVAVVNSINPYRIEGQKTAAFEVVDALGKAPTYQALPVGNAGNITAYGFGYEEYLNQGLIQNRPILLGYQAERAAPFLAGHPIENPTTVASAIRIGNPQSWENAWSVSHRSGGWFHACTDDEILAAQSMMAEEEGIFCEPASAISIAGVIRDAKQGLIQKGATVVSTLTGHGLKDPEVAFSQCQESIPTIPATLEALYDIFHKAKTKET